jgi:hypothetical protein
MRARSVDPDARPRDPGAFAAELASALSRFGEGPGGREAAPPRLHLDDEQKTVPALAPRHFPDDEEKTVPGFAPPLLPDDGDDPVTVELLPCAAPPRVRPRGRNASGSFAVLPPPVRAASEPATHGPPPPHAPRLANGGRPSAPKLKVVTSAETPAMGELCLTNEPRRWVVGRAASAHLVVADPDMSREHFAVMWEGEGRYRVRDLGSKNGLFVNGKVATDSQLVPGDEVRAGGTRLRFEA